MKTLNEIRKAQKELDPVNWGNLPDPYMKTEYNKTFIDPLKPSEKIRTKIRLNRLEWIFVGIMGFMSGILLLEIVERLLWLLK